jgi:hypothetical protein
MWPMLIWHIKGTRSGILLAMADRILSFEVISSENKRIRRLSQDFPFDQLLLSKNRIQKEEIEGFFVLNFSGGQNSSPESPQKVIDPTFLPYKNGKRQPKGTLLR